MSWSGNMSPASWSGQDVGIYALGLAWSVATWLLIAHVVSLIDEGARRRAAIGFASVAFAAVVVTSFGYRAYFHQTPSWQLVHFAVNEPRHAWIIASWSLHAAHVVAIGATIALVAFGLTRVDLAQPPKETPRLRAWGVRILYLTCTAFTLFVPGFQDPLPVEANTAAAFVQFGVATFGKRAQLTTPVRPGIAPQPKKARPSVLLIVNESMRADAQFPDLDYAKRLDARRVSPYLSTLPDRAREGFNVFPRARSNSTATESSVPTILSGLDLGAAADAFGRAHTVWSLGHAVGHATFLFSAQSYRWSHFDEFFFDRSLETAVTGKELGGEFVNDVGVDDRLAVDAAIRAMRELTTNDRRFLGVVHFSGSHLPGYPGPGVAPSANAIERWLQSATYIDSVTQRLVDAVLESPARASTVIVATSDHGEPLESPHGVSRLGSYYDETTRVPFWLFVPPELAAAHPEWVDALARWKDRNVQNIDVLPTIRDLLGLADEASLLPPVIAGRSLLRAPNPDDDILHGQSTCAFRTWSQEGLYVLRGARKLILSNERATPELFDLSSDPSESHNLWDDTRAREDALRWAVPFLRASPGRAEACQRAGKVCILD